MGFVLGSEWVSEIEFGVIVGSAWVPEIELGSEQVSEFELSRIEHRISHFVNGASGFEVSDILVLVAQVHVTKPEKENYNFPIKK